MFSRRPVCVLAFVAACATPTPEEMVLTPAIDGDDPNVATEHEDLSTPQAAFDQAGETFDVPSDLLIAIADAETGMRMIRSDEEFEGRERVFGLMALRADRVEAAAALAGVSPQAAERYRPHNIAAAAALLSMWADELAIDRSDLAAWAPLVARYSGIEDEEAVAQYVHDEVYERLRNGVVTEGLKSGTWDVVADFPDPQRASLGGAQRSYAIWRASPNNSARSGSPGMVIIHTCEGSYAGCWSWLSNSASGVSAHYVVNESGSEVSQLVQEDRRAWHISASYDCSRNNNVECWRNGASGNDFTIGIEHAGFGSQSSWSSGLLDISATLVSDILDDWNIPADAYHVVGHGQLQPWNRTDPGPNWPWSSYIADIQGGGGGTTNPPTPPTTPAGTRVIDSNNSANNSATEYIDVSANWTSSANVAGYYNTGYFWRGTGATSDAANFFFYNDDLTCYQVEAWWTSASDRSASAPFVMMDGSDTTIATEYVNQQINGGRWNVIGTYNFTNGWNRVALSRWTATGSVVIADAVRLVPSTSCSGGGTTNPPTGTPVSIIVDSDNALNGPDADVTFSSNWNVTNATSGYYGSDYAWAGAQRPHDPVSFWFHLDDAATVEVEARWTAGTNRADNTPFAMLDENTNLIGVQRVDQQINHATWVDLGTYDFPAGWNRVALSRRARTGYIVVADAVRVTEVP